MKIRSGFVSNSSSSSFVILYKDANDFSKFKDFNGYRWLMENLDRFDKAFIRQIIESFISGIRWKWYDRLKNPEYTSDDWLTQVYSALATDVEFDDAEFIEKLHSLLVKSADKCENPADLISTDELEKKLKVKKLTDNLLAAIYKKGYSVSTFEIADDTEYDYGTEGEILSGAYLEHSFLPFIERYPEGDGIRAYRESHH